MRPRVLWPHSGVSILVLVDVALEPRRTRPGGALGRLVSILVLVDVALEPLCRLPGQAAAAVSILVLVDVALERVASRCAELALCVSILVLVDVALEHDADYDRPREARKFQSLFSWMSLWNTMNRQCRSAHT